MDNKNNKYTLNNIILIITVIASILFLLLPIIGLFYGMISEGNRHEALTSILPTSRSLVLFIRSIVLSLLISITSLFIAIMAALGLYRKSHHQKKLANCIGYITIFMLLLPSFIHSQSWWKFFDVIALPIRGFVATWWVSTMYYLPLPLTLMFISLKAMDKDVLEAAAVFLNPNKALFGVIFPSLYPAIFGSGLLVFLLSLADYSIASIFSVNTYALDIFAQFSISGSISDALLYSMPLILVTIIVGIPGLRMLQNLSLTAKGEKGKKYVKVVLPTSIIVLSRLGLVILFANILIPFLTLIYSLVDGVETIKFVSTSIDEFNNTVFVAISALLISMPLSLILSTKLNHKRGNGFIYFILAIPLIMPSALIGIGLIGIFRNSFVYNTAIMPVLASVIRYTPIGILLCYSGIKALDQELLDTRLVYQKSVLNGFAKLYLPIILPFILMGGLSVSILSTGEVGATIMVLPPGFNTLAVKIYNYLHYGASNAVTVLCGLLVTFAVVATSTLICANSLLKKGRG